MFILTFVLLVCVLVGVLWQIPVVQNYMRVTYWVGCMLMTPLFDLCRARYRVVSAKVQGVGHTGPVMKRPVDRMSKQHKHLPSSAPLPIPSDYVVPTLSSFTEDLHATTVPTSDKCLEADTSISTTAENDMTSNVVDVNKKNV